MSDSSKAAWVQIPEHVKQSAPPKT